MPKNPIGRNIEIGVEDGTPKANWREPGQAPRSELNQRPASVARTQGARKHRASMYTIADPTVGPHIAKGEKAHTPTIAEVIRLRHKKERRAG